MNERIKELADYAYSYASEQAVEFTPEFMGYYDKKFAELIVRECARIVPDTDLGDVDGGDSAVLRAASKQIREHFGVDK